MRLLSVDPSITTIGVAKFLDGECCGSLTVRTKPTQTIPERLKIIGDHFSSIADKFDEAIIEYPDSFVRYGTYGVNNFSSLQLLHVAIGTIFAALASNPKLHVDFVKVSEWKGRSKKEETQYLVKVLIGKEVNTHEADAIIMGLRWFKTWKLKQIKS